VYDVYMTTEVESRWSLVETRSLDDLIALAVTAADRLPLRDDVLAREMVGAAAQLRASREALLFPDAEV
jgi:hypothetical protein